MPFIPIAEAIRLMRDDWESAKTLAEELFAMLTADLPADAPVAISKPLNSAAPIFKVGGYSNGDTLFEVTGAGGTPFGRISIQNGALVFEAPAVVAAAGAGAQIQGSTTMPLIPRSASQPGEPRRPQPPQQQSGGGGGGFPGQVVSGSGSTYQVNVYPAGTGGAAVLVSVKQLQIDPAETIPAGTWTTVVQTSDGSYSMQVPVWL